MLNKQDVKYGNKMLSDGNKMLNTSDGNKMLSDGNKMLNIRSVFSSCKKEEKTVC